MANEQKNQSETSKPPLSKKQIKVFQAWLNSHYGGRAPHIPFNDAKSIMIEKGLTGPVELTDEACPDVLFSGRIREAAPLMTIDDTHSSRAYLSRVCEPLTAINSSI